MPTGEFELIRWIRDRTEERPQVEIGPGDDTAVVRWNSNRCLFTTDSLLEGTCFLLAEAGPHRVGRKAMAVNLSDIAAMAGKPVAAVVSVCLPKEANSDLVQGLYEGMREVADEFETAIVGGDTSVWGGELVISVAMIGQVTGKGPVLRSGARLGDWVCVTGPLGGSIQGKHLDFSPRVHEAQTLHTRVDLTAMIDISDGLASDLNHICEESGCGAVLFSQDIPLTNESLYSPGPLSPVEHGLHDGEDLELLFTVSPEVGRDLIRTQPIQGVTISRIGECVDRGLWLQEEKSRIPLTPKGYVHTLD
ncbi:MAG: thiamine-monophosphate kinase [Gemmataceae bacterium]